MLQESTDTGSLLEIRGKQNLREGLTNVSDATQSFFVNLTSKSNSLATEDRLMQVGSKLHLHLTQTLLMDSNLITEWFSLFKEPIQNFDSEAEDECHAYVVI